MDKMLEEQIEDRDNGLYEGWLMLADITDWDLATKVYFGLVSINSLHIEVRGSHSFEPYMKFKTCTLHYACKGENSCSMMEYLERQVEVGLNYEGQHELIKLNTILLK